MTALALTSSHYPSDQIIRMVLQFDRGTLMAKFDMETIKRNIAVQPLPVGYAVALKVLH